MFRSAVLAAAGVAALLAPMRAQAVATANVQTLWAVYLDGLTDTSGVFSAGVPGVSVATSGDAADHGAWWGNFLTLQKSVDNGSQSFDASAAGSLTLSNSDPANIGKTLNIRQNASDAYLMLLGVTYPGLESASAVGSVTVPGYDASIPCGTGNDPGACDCTPAGCELADFAEQDSAFIIKGLGSFLTLDYTSTIHADLTGDPPSVPEPRFPWGLPLLLTAIMLPYVRFGRNLR